LGKPKVFIGAGWVDELEPWNGAAFRLRTQTMDADFDDCFLLWLHDVVVSSQMLLMPRLWQGLVNLTFGPYNNSFVILTLLIGKNIPMHYAVQDKI